MMDAALIVKGLFSAILIGAMAVYGVVLAYPLFNDDRELPRRRRLRLGIYLLSLIAVDSIILAIAAYEGVIS